LRDLGRALETILDPAAGSDDEGWRVASAEAVALACRADHAYVQLPAARRLYAGVGIDSETFAALERELAEASPRALEYRDPDMERLHRLGRRRPGGVFTRSSVSEAMGVPVEDTRIYAEVCVPAGMDDFAGITCSSPLGEAMLWVSRRGPRRGFEAAVSPALEVIRPAFGAALRSLERLAPKWPTADQLRPRYGLTAREAEVALLVARGASEKAIARELGISASTARHHTEKVFVKLGVRARAQVAPLLLGAD